MGGVWGNVGLWVPLSTAFVVQLFKFFTESWRNRKLDWRILGRSGGMPSSHSAMMTSLSTAMGYGHGFDSSYFAIATIVSIIVMYDAMGVRQQSGKQARVLNRIVREFFRGQPIREEELKELLGHTGVEVAVGALVGILYTLACFAWFVPTPASA